MRNAEAVTRKRTYAVIGYGMGFVAATTFVLTIAAALRIRIAAQRPAIHLAHPPRTGPTRPPPFENQDAISGLKPTEMLQGCLDCPLSSYLGNTKALP
jgi:hypothetical protein